MVKDDIRKEPKVIVFLSQLMLLFQHCFHCFTSLPDVQVTQSGTMVSISAHCKTCSQTYNWNSQPTLLGKFPAGNILLSFGILCAGASISKVLLVLKHMGVLTYNRTTYFYHQRHLLIPAVTGYWKKYQTNLIDRLKGKEADISGDGRHDSMGHSAKYCTYTIFSCTAGLILHIVLVQVSYSILTVFSDIYQ